MIAMTAQDSDESQPLQPSLLCWSQDLFAL
jgi:hypothetical protein